ncbi:ABC-type polar amino acid transport system ATPase subunit [Bradyrhizobium sp. LM2.7]
MIEFSHVNKQYGEYHALVDINAQIRKGEVVVVCGPSGSGKSTLIRTVNRLEEIHSGTLTFDGHNVHAKMSSKELNRIRSRIGFVFQSFNLFPHMSALENIMFSPIRLRGLKPADAHDKAMLLLDRVGLVNKARSYPAQLSGGTATAGRNCACTRDGAPRDAVRRTDERSRP